MKDKVISVKSNELNIEKVYLNNIRVEEGILKSTLTCTDSKMKKVQHEQNKVEVVLVDVLAPAALALLGLEAADEIPVQSKESGVDKKKNDAKNPAKKDAKKEVVKKPADKSAKDETEKEGTGTDGTGDEGSGQNPPV